MLDNVCSSLCRWRVGYQPAWVVVANGAEARKVEIAGGSAYHGVLLLTFLGGGQAHLPRDLAFFEPVVFDGEIAASPKTRRVYGEVSEASGGEVGFPISPGYSWGLGSRLTHPTGNARRRGALIGRCSNDGLALG